jgi:hypothetical protein
MAFDPDSIIRVANELKEAQEHVAQLEAKLKALVGGRIESIHSLGSFVVARSLPDKITELLKANPDKIFRFSDILKEVGGNPEYLRSTIARMIDDERIKRSGWGKYSAGVENKERPKAG